MTSFSIIIPCYNESHVLSRCLESIVVAIGSRSGVEILLMDNGSSDNSPEIARSFGARVQVQAQVSIATLRNLGAEMARGDVLLFLDSDIQVDPLWLDTLEDRFYGENPDQPNTDAIGFVDKAPEEASWYAKTWSLRATARRSTLREIDSLPGRNIAVTKKWFQRISGFNTELKTGEDKDFTMRLSKAGAKVISDPSLEMIHLGYERTFYEWCRKEYWRQHSHLDLLLHQGLSLRLLRFPLLSVAHCIGIALCIAIVMIETTYIAPLLFILTWIPSLALTLRYPYSRKNGYSILSFSLLYWLRFYIAGYSVAMAFVEKCIEVVKGKINDTQ
ncbi:MAG: glycosyltransferase [Pseudomonadales bacterium]|nr:glycosyltransferase [Pseudomonadales bacterium]